MKSFDDLEKQAHVLSAQIATAEANQDKDSLLKFKREYYMVKLDMLDIVDDSLVESQSVTAEQLRLDVENRPQIPRYMTGVDALDFALHGGIEIGTFVQLAGASFAGKTHLVVEILSNMSNGFPVKFFNFEMGDRRIIHRLQKTLTTPTQWNNFQIHNGSRSLYDIKKEIIKSVAIGERFFAIDSKMKIEVPDIRDDYLRFNMISSELAKLTQQHDIIIVLINQMNESDLKESRLAFKGSGDQMYDTDIALFYMLNDEEPTKRKLICRKNRQDEEQFVLDLQLNQYGKTVSCIGQPVESYSYTEEPVNNQRTEATQVNFPDAPEQLTMPTV